MSGKQPKRRLRFEALETRVLLSANNPFYNSVEPLDVNGDASVSPIDAMIVINQLNDQPSGLIELDSEGSLPPLFNGFIDVNNDLALSPVDALTVINGLNRPDLPAAPQDVITAADVETLLNRASAASQTSADAIVAIVDRGGTILGVRVGNNVTSNSANGIPNQLNTSEALSFAIDGAVAKARTAAFFANDAAPLTSRTIRMISQSTITQREVESTTVFSDINSTIGGPGTVAPIGVGAHFPPGVKFTPTVDLFDIEHTNRDSILHPGLNGIKEASDALLPYRFNVDPAFVPNGQEIYPPESYGFQSGIAPLDQARGIATLPGGIPLFKNGTVVGGIGVFFPGPDGYASHEQGFTDFYGPNNETGPLGNSSNAVLALRTAVNRTNAAKVLESEWIAFAAAGGSSGADASIGTLDGVAPLGQYDLPFGRLDLVGITLEVYGPNPTSSVPISGVDQLLATGNGLIVGDVNNGVNQKVGHAVDGTELFAVSGKEVPDGWLVSAHDGKPRTLTDENGVPILDSNGNPLIDQITQADVEAIIQQAIDKANEVRAGIRLDSNGKPSARTRMVFAVSDHDGEILGLFRMPDATYFSIAVAVAKSRNMAYYNDPVAVTTPDLCEPEQRGIAHTSRTFRFLADPRFPDGIDNSDAGCFSILNDQGVNPVTAENIGSPQAVADFTSVLGFTRFNPERNFRRASDTTSVLNENGVVYFPGSSAIYKSGGIIGGLGVSGDGVDQDDVVTASAIQGYGPSADITADNLRIDTVRLPYLKFLRNPLG